MFKNLGKLPSVQFRNKISSSKNYIQNEFQNQSETIMMAKGVNSFKILLEFINKPKTILPSKKIPSIKTNLNKLNTSQPIIIWFGHSSYFICVDEKNILVDPVFSGNASPVPGMIKSFDGSDVYSVADLPEIDILLLTHDHYDHLDYKTILKLKSKVKQVICSLGVSSHLIYWGYHADIIQELDWWEQKTFCETLEFTAAPARHFSGRSLKRNQTLWSSFILKSSTSQIYLGGDSGYDQHFVEIGNKFKRFDLAILECGQYHTYWPNIHMQPEETVQACIDLNADILLPVHWGKFSLSMHPWNEPIKRALHASLNKNLQITTPLIGQPIILHSEFPQNYWWDAL